MEKYSEMRIFKLSCETEMTIRPICLSHYTIVGPQGLAIYGLFSNHIISGGEGELYKIQSTV